MPQTKSTETGPNPSGICMCGCGKPAPISTRHNPRIGVRKGEHFRFIIGHAARVQKWKAGELRYVVDDSGCHVFQGYCTPLGYGMVTRQGRPVQAYRVAYQQARGEIPAGLVLDHLCRNPSCINPDHLEPVTHAENIRRGKNTKLTIDQVRQIRELARTTRACDIARQMELPYSRVSNVVARRTWADIP